MNRRYHLLLYLALFLLLSGLSGCVTDALGQVPTETNTPGSTVSAIENQPTYKPEETENIPNPYPAVEAAPATINDTDIENSEVIYYITGGQLFSINPVTKETTVVLPIPADFNGASFSKDFGILAYASANQVFLVDVETGEQINSISGEPGETVIPRGFNPNSTRQYSQLLLRRDTESKSSFGIMNLGSDTSWVPLPEPPGSTHYGCDTGTAWSPNGDRIVITGLGYGMACNVNPGITLFSIRRGMTFSLAEQQLPKGISGEDTIKAGARTPAWSLDGKFIFVSMEDETNAPLQFTSRIYQIDETGKNTTRITDNSRGIAAFPVMIDANTILYSISGDSPQTDGIYIHDLVSGNRNLEEKGASLCPLALSIEKQLLLYGRTCNEYGQAHEIRVKILGENSSISLARSLDGQPITYLGWKFKK